MAWNLGLLGATVVSEVPNAYELLETTVLGGTASSVTFSNLNSNYGSTYQHLQIRFVFRPTATDTSLMARMNGDGNGGNYNGVWFEGSGTGAGQSSRTDTNSLIFFYPQDFSNSASGAFYVGILDILDPFETTKNTTIRCFLGSSATNPKVGLATGAWFNTAALTSFGLSVGTGNPAPWQGSNFNTNSRFSLYGIKGA
jgi:hypothetical protein